MRIGITGHRNFAGQSDKEWVRSQIATVLAKYDKWTIAVTSLAIGADQIFAQAALDRGMPLMAILPFADIRRTFDAGDVAEYDRLLASSKYREIIPPQDSDEDAYVAAGYRVVELCDILVAVWDGLPPKGKGGTGEIVEYAKGLKDVIWLDPLSRGVNRL